MRAVENELYQELTLYDGETKIGECEIEIKGKMLSRLVIYEPYQDKGYGLSIALNNMRITYPKIYGILTPIQTWDIDYSDLFDAIPIDIIKYYADKKLGNVAKENEDE